MPDEPPPASTDVPSVPTEKYLGPLPGTEDHDLPDGGRYRPLYLHRKGGMGRVFVAEDGELKRRRVALKDIQAKHRDQPWAVPRFLFEAEVTGELEHPGIVPVYGLGRCDRGRPYYAMRFVDGITLTDAIREFHESFAETGSPRSLTADQAVRFRGLLSRFLAVCQTVAYAHSKGVLHRDLKPANILLGQFGETLVIDWGLARRLTTSDRPTEAPTTDGAVGTSFGGSPPWWAPEQSQALLGPQDERTDVYGLGAILFHILAGQSPHPSGRHPETPPGVRDQSPWVDGALEEIVRISLSRDADERPQSAGELATRVEAWLADQPVASQQAVVAQLRDRAAARRGDRVLEEMYARQMSNLGQVYAGMGREEAAANVFANAAAVFADLFLAYKKARYRAEEANCLFAQSQALNRLGRADESAAVSRKAAGIYEQLSAEHPDLYTANLAELTLAFPRGFTIQAPPADTPTVRPPVDPEETPVPNTDPPGYVEDGVSEIEFDLPSAPGEATVDVVRLDADPSPDTRPAVSAVNALVGDARYTLIRELGTGGMATVWLARDEPLGRRVAIKVWRRTNDRELVRQAEYECRLTARLDHPNIVKVYATGQDATGTSFLVMQYLPGEDLAEAVMAFHGSPQRLVRDNAGYVRLIAAVAVAADALAFAHRRGVLHLDPKPRNIQFGRHGEAVLFDWGVARRLADTAADLDDADFLPPLANIDVDDGAVMGTPIYMAPEMVTGHQNNWDRRTDVYILGATLFEVITGSRFRVGETVMDLLTAAREGFNRRPGDVRPDVPPELDAICAKATAFHPDDRYQTADAFAADLRAWLAGRPVSVYQEGFARRFWRTMTGTGRS